MKKQYLFILLIVILLLSACAKESTAVPETQNQMPVPSSAPQNEDTSEGKPVDFRFLYRGFSAVPLDDFSAMSDFMEFGAKIIDNDESWQAFMASYCPGIPYDEEWDFSKEYIIASITHGARPTYAVCNKLTGLSLADGHFVFEYENDPAEYIYALNGDDTAHFYVEVIIVGRENMPDDAADLLYLPAEKRGGLNS